MPLQPKKTKGYLDKSGDIPRILKYQIDKNKDFRTIDHNTELTISLEKKEVYGSSQSDRGLLLKKEYYLGNELLFFIDYTYEFNTIGEVRKQRLILYWLNEDGKENVLTKDKGLKRLSKKESRVIVSKRRSSVIELLEIEIIELLTSASSNENEINDAINLGANMMSDVSVEIDKFKNSGNHEPLVNKLESLKGVYLFLNNEIVPGVTVVNYISNFLNY